MPSPARILVVEDEARTAEVVEGYLEAQGHTVVRAASGEDALAAAATRRAELAGRLQGMEFEPCERTIDAHVKNLWRKLGDDARAPRLILTVYGRGYVFAEDLG